MQQLRNATSFPPIQAFFNKLKQQHISEEDYYSSKSLFESKQAAGEWKNMGDYLKYYNLLDVEPLVQAITICFDNYAKFFNVDACSRMSLPSIGFEAMYAMHDQCLPFVFTFNDKNAKKIGDYLKRMVKINPTDPYIFEKHLSQILTNTNIDILESKMAKIKEKISKFVDESKIFAN